MKPSRFTLTLTSSLTLMALASCGSSSKTVMATTPSTEGETALAENTREASAARVALPPPRPPIRPGVPTTGTGTGTTTGSGTTVTTLPTVFKKFSTKVTATLSGTNVVLKSDGVPDHKSPYFAKTDSRYEAYNGTNKSFKINPNSIKTQNVEIRIPANPAQAKTHSATGLGPIGMALNGVTLFNQYAGPNTPLTNEINSFDQYNGHPQQTGMYHYHVEPLALTAKNGKSSLIGFLLDGFPVYGPQENGKTLTSANLDTYHGHTAVTPEYPQGIYHYHITADSPYINGGQYYGTPGTTTN